ncbi:hypothetical protein DFS33DRAFT_1384402 [Desarmillaria ectypa]|nr:hypothetical protein DFS33DRAFT_1384402 [Desarmillaria ectypa]
MSAPETATKFAPTQSSSVLGGQIVGRSERRPAPPAAVKLRLDLNLEVEIAIQAKVNGDITLSLLAAGQLNLSPVEIAKAESLRPWPALSYLFLQKFDFVDWTSTGVAQPEH